MQNALLGVAIALILALVAALVGPHVVDWARFRPAFEQEAARLIGLPVRVTGAIDARLLPTPSVKLGGVVVARSGEPARFTADEIDVQFSLGSLLRGETRASELEVSGATLALGLDANGRIDWPGSIDAVNLGGLTIDRLAVRGRVRLSDAASGGALDLEDVAFTGDVRPHAGVVRGNGTFRLAAERVPFRVSTGRAADGNGARMRLVLEGAIGVDVDAAVTLHDRVPRLDGTVSLNSSGRRDQWPWQAAAKLVVDAARARFDAIEATLGGNEGGIKWGGQAELAFGAKPGAQLTLQAKTFDADRVVAALGGASGAPVLTMAALGDLVRAMPRAVVPTRLNLSTEPFVWNGRTLPGAALEAQGTGPDWDITAFEIRGPGATTLSARGRLTGAGQVPVFDGRAALEIADPALFGAWLFGRSDVAAATLKPWRANGAVRLAADAFALRELTATVQGLPLAGDIDLGGPNGARHAALRVTAPSLDEMVDVARSFAPSIVVDTQRLSRGPGQAVLSVALDAPALTANLQAPAFNGDIRVAAASEAWASIAAFATAPLQIHARVGAERADVLLRLLDLDGAIAAGAATGEVTVDATTSLIALRHTPVPLRAALRVGAARATFDGEVDEHAESGIALRGNVEAHDLDLRPLFGMPVAEGPTLPANARVGVVRTAGKLTLAPMDIELLGMHGRGKLDIDRTNPPRLTGAIDFPALDVPTVLGLALGVRPGRVSEPFALGLVGRFGGRLAVTAERARLAEGTEAQALAFVMRGENEALYVDDGIARLGEGKLGGRGAMIAGPDGRKIELTLTVKGADAGGLRYRALAMPSGTIDATVTLTGQGRSPAALVGALTGEGRANLAGVRFAGLSPHAFLAAERLVGAGNAADKNRLHDLITTNLEAGSFEVPSASAVFNVADGRVRLPRTEFSGAAPPDGAHGEVAATLTLQGGYELATAMIEARATLTGVPQDAGTETAPQLHLMWQGPADAPLRTLDATPLAGWIIRRTTARETQRLDAMERNQPAQEDNARGIPAASAPSSDGDPAGALAKPAPLPPPIDVRRTPGAITSGTAVAPAKKKAPPRTAPLELVPPAFAPASRPVVAP